PSATGSCSAGTAPFGAGGTQNVNSCATSSSPPDCVGAGCDCGPCPGQIDVFCCPPDNVLAPYTPMNQLVCPDGKAGVSAACVPADWSPCGVSSHTGVLLCPPDTLCNSNPRNPCTNGMGLGPCVAENFVCTGLAPYCLTPADCP